MFRSDIRTVWGRDVTETLNDDQTAHFLLITAIQLLVWKSQSTFIPPADPMLTIHPPRLLSMYFTPSRVPLITAALKWENDNLTSTTVNRIHGWETHWNSLSMLGRSLCKNVVLPYHVYIVFSPKSTNCNDLNWPIVMVMVGWLHQDVAIGCLSKKTIHTWWGRTTFLHKPGE